MLFILYARTPFWINIVAGPTISYISIVMNIIIFVALFHKKIRTPTTVLMQGLAMADGLTALCTYGFEPFFNLHYEEIGRVNISVHYTVVDFKEMKSLVGLRFPYCIIHYWLTNLVDTFHLVSILLTASLGLQKLLAVACPVWSKTQINERKSCIVCGTSFLFSIVVNIPRCFVISFSNGKKGDTCLVSEPHWAIQKYILAYYPIFHAIILVGAVVTMLISTCYIIFTLCRRKRVRGHATVSEAEKKSCILIICVMVVFFLAEVPRIYVSSTLYNTYRSNLDTENVALHKTNTGLSQRHAECFGDIPNHFSEGSCISDFDELPSRYKEIVSRELEAVTTKVLQKHKKMLDSIYYDQLKQNYSEYLVDVLVNQHIRHGKELFKNFNKQNFLNIAVKAYCNITTKSLSSMLKGANVEIHPHCHHDIYSFDASFFILGSSPYSEPMNYIMNIVFGHIGITLEHLKLLTEILKLSMIIGCASNFLIYIVMSKKLREALKKTFICREHQEDAIRMQIRG